MFCTIKAKTQKQTNELNLPPTRGAVCHVLIQHGLEVSSAACHSTIESESNLSECRLRSA